MGACKPTAASATPPSAEPALPAACVAVAYSGGRDSTALLHATLAVAPPALKVLALHVHHGLSPYAEDWLEHCRAQCKTWSNSRWPVEFVSTRLTTHPAAGDSVEAWARTMRYQALGRMALAHGADTVLLAHHRRDQAETFLLQALRGAGMAGLAGMPRAAHRNGIAWLRPWLARSRADIEAYVKQHRLEFVEDHSNEDPRHARNRLRLQVWPALEQAFAQTESALADSAHWAQEAHACLAELAMQDMQALLSGAHGLKLKPLLELSPARRSNLLRAWLRLQTGRAAPASLVSRLLDELRPQGVARWELEGAELRSYRGALSLEPTAAAVARDAPRESGLAVHGVGDYPLPGWAGCLQVAKVAHGGVPMAYLAAIEFRPLQGAVQFQAGPDRPARSLKKQFQAAGIPAWKRSGPLLFSGGRLLFVPGLGLDARVIAAPGQDQVSLHWRAFESAQLSAAEGLPTPARIPG